MSRVFRIAGIFLAVSLHCKSTLSDTPRVVALSGQTVPGTPDVTYAFNTVDTNQLIATRDVAINNLGQVAYQAELSDGTSAILTESTIGQSDLIAKSGTRPPGAPEDMLYEYFPSRGTAINDSGRSCFLGNCVTRQKRVRRNMASRSDRRHKTRCSYGLSTRQ